MKRKKSDLQKAKEKLWKLVSLYVRTKDMDQSGNATCVTCGETRSFKELQAGHFIPKAIGLAIRFELRNIHVQCYRCNINLGSNGPKYYQFMLEKYGQETIDELILLSNTTVNYYLSDYEEMVEAMENMLEELNEN